MKAAVYIIGVVFLGVLALSYQHLDSQVSTLTTQLVDTTALLRKARSDNRVLTSENTDLSLNNANLGKVNAELKEANASAETKVYKGLLVQNETDRQLSSTIRKLSAAQQRKAADTTVGGVGAIVVTDSNAVRRDVATLKAQLKNRDEIVIPGLRTDLEKQTKRADTAEGQISDLEKVLNTKSNADADRIKVVRQKKHLFGIGVKNDMLKAENDVRAGQPQMIQKP